MAFIFASQQTNASERNKVINGLRHSVTGKFFAANLFFALKSHAGVATFLFVLQPRFIFCGNQSFLLGYVGLRSCSVKKGVAATTRLCALG
jgi:hypothetical protein